MTWKLDRKTWTLYTTGGRGRLGVEGTTQHGEAQSQELKKPKGANRTQRFVRKLVTTQLVSSFRRKIYSSLSEGFISLLIRS